jgi:hypothetical protein
MRAVDCWRGTRTLSSLTDMAWKPHCELQVTKLVSTLRHYYWRHPSCAWCRRERRETARGRCFFPRLGCPSECSDWVPHFTESTDAVRV